MYNRRFKITNQVIEKKSIFFCFVKDGIPEAMVIENSGNGDGYYRKSDLAISY